MNKKIFLTLASLAALVLTACSGPSESSQQASSSSSKSSRHTHSWDAGVVTTPATCTEDGEKTFTCACSETKKETIPATGHTWNAGTKSHEGTCQEETLFECTVCHITNIVSSNLPHTWSEPVAHASETDSDYTVKECSVCHKKDVSVNALDYTKMVGSNKDTSGATLKLSTNTDYVEYDFSLNAAVAGSIYIYGWVDYWKDGSNNNDQRTFTSRKSGEGFNLEVTVNGTLVVITNFETYEGMGMTEGIDGHGSFTLCELGAASLTAGANKIKYARIESYNLNITEIHVIG